MCQTASKFYPISLYDQYDMLFKPPQPSLKNSTISSMAIIPGATTEIGSVLRQILIHFLSQEGAP